MRLSELSSREIHINMMRIEYQMEVGTERRHTYDEWCHTKMSHFWRVLHGAQVVVQCFGVVRVHTYCNILYCCFFFFPVLLCSTFFMFLLVLSPSFFFSFVFTLLLPSTSLFFYFFQLLLLSSSQQKYTEPRGKKSNFINFMTYI